MYKQAVDAFYGVIASTEWQATFSALGVKTVPRSFQGATSAPYIRVTVLPGNGVSYTHSQSKQLDGLLIMSIFSDTASGDGKVSDIADTIDNFFAKKQLSRISTGHSSMNIIGIDTENSALYRADYSVPFTFFGD